MILAHALVGITAGEYTNYFWFVFLGSIFPDVDHLIVLAKNKTFSLKKIIRSMRFDGKHRMKYKTKYVHSFFGSLLFSSLVLIIDKHGALYFFFGYLGHLLLDWVDHDQKQYFFPFKRKTQGFLPIFSKPEIVFTLALFVFMIMSIKK